MKIDIDVIGLLFTSLMVDEAGNVTTPPTAQAGWHVNTTRPVLAWTSKKVTPPTPRRVFAGIETHFYTFANESEYLTLADVDLTIVAATEVPAEVPMRQARLALLGAGKLAAVDSSISAMLGVRGEAARIEWEYSNTIKRNQPLVIALGGALGLTSKQMDDLFILAATL